MGEVSAGCLHCSTAGISKNCWKGVGMHQRAPWREKKSTQKPNRCTQGAWNPAVHDMKALFCKSYCTHTRRRELSTGRQHVKLLIAAHCWPGPARHAQHMWQPDSPVNRPKQASWQNPQALFLPCTASPSPEPAQRLLCVGHSIARTHTHTHRIVACLLRPHSPWLSRASPTKQHTQPPGLQGVSTLPCSQAYCKINATSHRRLSGWSTLAARS